MVAMALMTGILTGCMNAPKNNQGTTTSKTTTSEITTSETTISDATEKKNGATYTIKGVEFTISHPIEDYLYTLPGSSAKYIDLDKFMEAYGLHRTRSGPQEEASHFTKEGVFSVALESTEFELHSNDGLGICHRVNLGYDPSQKASVIGVDLTSSSPIDNDNGVYGVNAFEKDGTIKVKYCVTKEMLVVFGVIFDSQNKTGSTEGAAKMLAKGLNVTSHSGKSGEVYNIAIE